MLTSKVILVFVSVSALFGCGGSSSGSSSNTEDNSNSEIVNNPITNTSSDNNSSGISGSDNGEHVTNNISYDSISILNSSGTIDLPSSNDIETVLAELVEAVNDEVEVQREEENTIELDEVAEEEVMEEVVEEVVNETVILDEVVVIEEYVFQPEVEMDELRASADFSFSDKNQITVSIDIAKLLAENGQTGARAYLSIYSDYRLLPTEKFYPDASSRVLAGDLSDGTFNQSFVALNEQSDYLIEVWFYNGEQPLQTEKAVIKNSLIW